MDKIWRLGAREEAVEHRLTAEVGVTPLVARLLAQRGITEPKAARRFLHPETEQRYHDPFLLLDMEKAVVRVEKAIAAGEKIAVYGDYDVDGITATTLLLRTLRRLGAKASYYIPVRQEGYGLHEEALRRLAKEGVSVVVTVDCGISAVEEVAMLHGSLDIVITDHHLPGTVLPPAVAVVNPHREGDTYPFSDLAGVGVAWKLCQALWQRLRGEEFTEDLELVALGTVADMVPLLDENRKLVREGLRCFSKTTYPDATLDELFIEFLCMRIMKQNKIGMRRIDRYPRETFILFPHTLALCTDHLNLRLKLRPHLEHSVCCHQGQHIHMIWHICLCNHLDHIPMRQHITDTA